jgi:hypothetical protein
MNSFSRVSFAWLGVLSGWLGFRVVARLVGFGSVDDE